MRPRTIRILSSGLLLFPDMQRNEAMERMAVERYHVYIIWGLDNLREDLERIVKEEGFKRPPKSRIAEKEWRGLHELQFQGAGGARDSGQPPQGLSAPRETGLDFTLGAATINIQHLDTLIVQQCPMHVDSEGQPFIPGT